MKKINKCLLLIASLLMLGCPMAHAPVGYQGLYYYESAVYTIPCSCSEFLQQIQQTRIRQFYHLEDSTYVNIVYGEKDGKTFEVARNYFISDSNSIYLKGKAEQDSIHVELGCSNKKVGLYTIQSNNHCYEEQALQKKEAYQKDLEDKIIKIICQ